jgi:hypothetical protein
MRQPRCEVGLVLCSEYLYCMDLKGGERRVIGITCYPVTSCSGFHNFSRYVALRLHVILLD